MTQVFGDIRSGLLLLMALVVSGAGWWLVVAEPETLPGVICGVAGFGAEGAWSTGLLFGRAVMWMAMMLAMALPVGVVIEVRAGRAPDAGFLAGYGVTAASVAVVAAVVEWAGSSLDSVSAVLGSANGTVSGATFMALGLLNLAAAVFRRSSSCMSDDELERKSPPKSSPQGGGLNPAAWLLPRYFAARPVPRDLTARSALGLGLMGATSRLPPCGGDGRQAREGLFQGLHQGRLSLTCSLTMVGLQLILGTMSLVLMFAMTLWMLAEALLPERRELPMALGAALIMAGLSIIAVTSVT